MYYMVKFKDWLGFGLGFGLHVIMHNSLLLF